MCWSSGRAYGLPRRASYPSRSRSLVCKIPITLLGLSETKIISYIIHRNDHCSHTSRSCPSWYFLPKKLVPVEHSDPQDMTWLLRRGSDAAPMRYSTCLTPLSGTLVRPLVCIFL